MKRTSFITIFLFISNLIFAQSVNDLDIKNGFRNFKLGSSPSQIKNIVKNKNQLSANPNIVTYDYVGNDIEYVYHVKVDQVTLRFFKNKLFGIAISFGNVGKSRDFELYEFNSIRYALEKIYGIDWYYLNNHSGLLLNGAMWEGKNVELQLSRVDYRKSHGVIIGLINIYDKKLTNECYANDF